MRKIMFVGRSESGKTTIMQAMKGKPITYHKTQYVNNFDVIIDTPGEYAETKQLSGALAVYGCEADIIGLLMSAIEPFSLYPPNVVSVSNREVVGVVTKCDHWAANPELAAECVYRRRYRRNFKLSQGTCRCPSVGSGESRV